MILERLTVVVSGYLVRRPVGGLAWHYGQYVDGLRRLGHRVYYLEDSGDLVAEVAERLRELEPYLPKMAAEERELTLLADKSIQFKVLKKIMSTCTAAGYGKISLAVIQKEIRKI